jgi:hypothetical protein
MTDMISKYKHKETLQAIFSKRKNENTLVTKGDNSNLKPRMDNMHIYF